LNGIPGISCVTPRGAFYAFPNITAIGLDSKELADRLLEEAGVAVFAGSAFGSFGGGELPPFYATLLENLPHTLSALGDFFAARVAEIARAHAGALEHDREKR